MGMTQGHQPVLLAEVLAGLGNKFEIWNEEAWERNCVDWVSAESGGGELPDSLETLTL